MKLKNEIFVNGFVDALRSLLKQNISVIQGLELFKLAKEVEDKSKIYDEARSKIVSQYTELDAEGKPTPVLDKELKVVEGKVNVTNVEAFNKDVTDLLAHEEEYVYEKQQIVSKDRDGKEIELKPLEVGLLVDVVEFIK